MPYDGGFFALIVAVPQAQAGSGIGSPLLSRYKDTSDQPTIAVVSIVDPFVTKEVFISDAIFRDPLE